MDISNKIKELKDQIQNQRQTLENNLDKELTENNVIKVSEDMDQLIVLYYRYKKSEAI